MGVVQSLKQICSQSWERKTIHVICSLVQDK